MSVQIGKYFEIFVIPQLNISDSLPEVLSVTNNS